MWPCCWWVPTSSAFPYNLDETLAEISNTNHNWLVKTSRVWLASAGATYRLFALSCMLGSITSRGSHKLLPWNLLLRRTVCQLNRSDMTLNGNDVERLFAVKLNVWCWIRTSDSGRDRHSSHLVSPWLLWPDINRLFWVITHQHFEKSFAFPVSHMRCIGLIHLLEDATRPDFTRWRWLLIVWLSARVLSNHLASFSQNVALLQNTVECKSNTVFTRIG